jgi:hypothetical protein
LSYNVHNYSNESITSGEIGIVSGSFAVSADTYGGLNAEKIKVRAINKSGTVCGAYRIDVIWAIRYNQGEWNASRYHSEIDETMIWRRKSSC